MKPAFKSTLLGGLLFCIGAVAQAQPAGPAAHPEMRAHMQEHMRQRAADLKAKLKLTPEQEGAWTTYMAALKPSADVKRADRGDMEKLSTPQRLDKMRELRKQRDAEADKREDATRTFYAALSAEQKSVFDASTGRAHHHGPAPEPRKP